MCKGNKFLSYASLILYWCVSAMASRKTLLCRELMFYQAAQETESRIWIASYFCWTASSDPVSWCILTMRLGRRGRKGGEIVVNNSLPLLRRCSGGSLSSLKCISKDKSRWNLFLYFDTKLVQRAEGKNGENIRHKQNLNDFPSIRILVETSEGRE